MFKKCDTFCWDVRTVRSLWCTQIWTYMWLKSVLTSHSWTVPLTHHRLPFNTPVGFTLLAAKYWILTHTHWGKQTLTHTHTHTHTRTHTHSYKPWCHHCFVNVGQCVSIPNTTESSRRRRRSENSPEWINQMFWFVAEASQRRCLVATWALRRRANQTCLPPPPPPPPPNSFNDECVCVCGKGLAGGCMYECTMYVCMCVCVCVCMFLLQRTFLLIAVNSGWPRRSGRVSLI